MFTLVFRFPTGRYHATPWGRHVNEGGVAWPPEPYRILRALIATWHRKADHERFGEPNLRDLIEGLAGEMPLFRLPDAVHAHTRHYMPQGKLTKGREDTKLIFDAFLRVAPEDELVAVWQQTVLSADAFALAEYLAERINYFGRAESLVCARAGCELKPEPLINCRPEASNVPGSVAVQVLAPLSPAIYAANRGRLMGLNTDRASSKKRLEFTATLPPSLFEAIQVETASLQAAGWSQPPAGRLILYHRPEIGPQPPAHRSRPRSRSEPATVARLVLAGRPQPRVEDAVKIGEVFRSAMMAHVTGEIPAVLSGRSAEGTPLHDPQHGHAFFLAEDHDRNGFIDHLVLHIRDGLPPSVLAALDRLRRLWIADRRRVDPQDDPDEGRQEWRVALEGLGQPSDFSDSALLRASKIWVSVTPYLRPWHIKGSDTAAATRAMLLKECRIRGLPECQIEHSGDDGRAILVSEGVSRGVLRFHRFRSRSGLLQPDRSGTALRLSFEKPISGPIALGFGCHFGLGLFRTARANGSSA